MLYKRGGQKRGGQNQFFKRNEDAIEFMQTMNTKGYDVWFALALFGEDTKRTQANAVSASSFWLDIDVGEDKPYQSVAEAAEALGEFCKRIKLPIPTVVGSGTGIHAHWLIDQRITRERWERSAKSLKRACQVLELKAGPERTADIASVLRVPGTKHLKNPLEPKDVTLYGPITPPVALAAFEQAVTPYVEVDNVQAANKVFETTLPKLPYDAEKIAEGCAVVREMRATRGQVSEPHWYATLQVLAHCVDGEQYAHEWSNGHKDYTHGATQEKYERAGNFGPTVCARFAELQPSACAACPHNGKITTPLQLGATLTPVKISRPAGVHNPAPAGEHSDSLSVGEWQPTYITPPHYQVGEQGVYFVDDENAKRVPVLDVPLWVSQVIDSIHETDMEARIEWVTRTGRHRQSTMRVDTLMDIRATGMWLASRGITGFSPRALEAVKNYVWACVQVYLAGKDTETVYEHFGWYRDGFVLGARLLVGDKNLPAQLAGRVPTKMKKYLVTRGDLDAWAQATESIAEDKYWPHQFTLTAALGSVLFQLMGVQGAVLSLAGDSGVGKTTIGQFALSAFGDPKALEMSPQSTEKSFHEIWYIANNLPVLINEAATLDLFKLSSLIYAAANGQARATLTRNSELRESDGWQLLTIFTSNAHLMSLDEKWLNEANRRRILEITMSQGEHEMDRHVALVLHRTMADHYGHAGEAFIQYVVEHRAEITSLLREIYEAYCKGDIPAEHRFCLWMIAVARVAGIIGERIGILRFNTERCCTMAQGVVKAQARAVVTVEEKVKDVLADYISDNQGSFTRYDGKNRLWSQDMRGICAGKYVKDEQGKWSLSVPQTRFATYCRERGVDKQHIARWIKDAGVKSQSVKLVPLGTPTRSLVIPIEGDLDTE